MKFISFHFVSSVVAKLLSALSSVLWIDCRLPSNFVNRHMLTIWQSEIRHMELQSWVLMRVL